MASISALAVNAQDGDRDGKLRCAIDFATASSPASDQFDAFRSIHDGVVDISLTKSAGPSFPVREMVWNLGKFVFLRISLPGNGYALRWRHLKKTSLDNWYLILPYDRAEHEDGSAGPAVFPTGAPSFHCLAQPFEADIEASEALVLFIPRDLFAPGLPLDDKLVGSADRRFGYMLGEYLLMLNRSLPDLRMAEVPYVVEATRCLLAMCMAPADNRHAKSDETINSILIERARTMISRRLAEFALTPDLLCDELGVSRSRLYKLFEPYGGVSSYIRRQRLLRTQYALSDRSDRRSISRIAEQWGFFDASAYSRTFRQEFGLSPKKAREAGWDGYGYVVGQSKVSAFDRPASLASLLRGLSA